MMTTDKPLYSLPVWETIKTSWHKIKGAKGTVWAAIGIMILITIGMGIVAGIAKMLSPILADVVNVIAQIITFLLQAGLIYIGIQWALDLPISYRMVFRAFHKGMAIKVVLLYILQVLILLIPMIIIFIGALPLQHYPILAALFLIIGCVAVIYLSVRMILAMGFVLDKEMAAWPAIKLSFAVTRCQFWRLIGVYIMEFIILAVSMIPILLGLIWTLPFAVIVYGIVYKRLSANHL